MSADMKITMLGASGTGKTCFMVGMYSVMREGVRGFTFNADPDLDLKLSDDWDHLVETDGEDRWPPPTGNKPIPYAFDFSYGMNKLAGFEWLDYRGGALRDRSSAADVQELRQHLKGSASIFLCVSGEHLAGEVENRAARVRNQAQVGRMNQYLMEVMRERSDPPSVAIVITKYDCCADRDRGEVIEEIREIFNPLFARDTGWLVMICPVSLGMALAGNPTGGIIAPTNIHLPVTFSIYAGFMREAARMTEAAKAGRDTVNNLSTGWWSRLVNKSQIQTGHRTIEISQAQVREMEARMKLLAQDLMGQPRIYLGGKEVTLHG
jgi:hypothetical protein